MARIQKKKATPQPLPSSGERVIGMPPPRSKFLKAPKPMTPAEQGATRKATNRRQAWEATPEGQARTRNISDLMGTSATPAQVYMMANYDKPEHVGPRAYDVQLPGMADPTAAPRPPKWEELSPETQMHVERGLKKHGTSIDQMIADIGAQYDQSQYRAWQHGHAQPFSETFYSTGEPRQVLEKSAKELDIPPTIHAQMNAMTSPNTKFVQTSQGKVTYPNDTAAKHAVLWVKHGRKPEELTNELSTTGLHPTQRAQGYVTNMVKAAKAFSQYRRGVQPADWVTGKDEGGPFESSPKTGPYANSWSDTHPQFFVSDVHSGGGGFLPHLATGKAEGKSDRELAIERTPFFHSVADYAARQAMKQRGIGHTREFQAAQWGEEQIQRGLEKPSRVYVKKKKNSASTGQQTLF